MTNSAEDDVAAAMAQQIQDRLGLTIEVFQFQAALQARLKWRRPHRTASARRYKLAIKRSRVAVSSRAHELLELLQAPHKRQ